MPKPECFIAMPMTSSAEHDETYEHLEHWRRVMEVLFAPAIEAAGMKPILPMAGGAEMIHGSIIENITNADMVLCDLSSHNPNVLFELGVRTSLDLPIALVVDERTDLPFDVSGINTYSYESSLRGWEVESQRKELTDHIKRCVASCDGKNPLWQHFGLTIKAQEPIAEESPIEAKVDLLSAKVEAIQVALESGGRSVGAPHRVAIHRGSDVSMNYDELRKVSNWTDSKNEAVFMEEVERTLVHSTALTMTPLSAGVVVVRLGPGDGRKMIDRLERIAKKHGIDLIINDYH